MKVEAQPIICMLPNFGPWRRSTVKVEGGPFIIERRRMIMKLLVFALFRSLPCLPPALAENERMPTRGSERWSGHNYGDFAR